MKKTTDKKTTSEKKPAVKSSVGKKKPVESKELTPKEIARAARAARIAKKAQAFTQGEEEKPSETAGTSYIAPEMQDPEDENKELSENKPKQKKKIKKRSSPSNEKTAEVLSGIAHKNLFDFEIEQLPIYTGAGEVIQGYKTIVGNGKTLNVCKNSYTPMTNAGFSMLAEDISEIMERDIASARSFKNDTRQLIFLESTDNEVNQLKYSNKMVIGNSHDASTGIFIGIHNTFLHCENQFFAANRKADYKVYHTLTMEERIPQILNTIKAYTQLEDNLKDKFDKMLKSTGKCTEESIIEFLHIINHVDDPEKISTRKRNIMAQQQDCIMEEIDIIGNNVFSLFNGITRFSTHIKKAKNKEYSTITGTVADLNNIAFDTALEMVS